MTPDPPPPPSGSQKPETSSSVSAPGAAAPGPAAPGAAAASTSPWPGLALAALAAAVAAVVARFLPTVSALLIAILLGIALVHVVPLGERWRPGLAIAAKRLLRLGIVLLGLQLSLRDIAALGPGVIALVVTVVAVGVVVTSWMGRRMGLSPSLSLLVASGFSICGAAAVAAVEEESEADETETATAIGLVVLFGTIMIGVVPLLAGLVGLHGRGAGLLAGAAIHEVAQVVAAAGIIGGATLATAVLVKLSRVLMLAPLILALGWRRRRSGRDATDRSTPLVPLFVAAFVGMTLVRTWVPVPEVVLDWGKLLQVLLLAAAMFALGTGVHVSLLRKVGGRPVVLGALSTLLVTTIALAGALLLG